MTKRCPKSTRMLGTVLGLVGLLVGSKGAHELG
jgi:hypothetical protein